MLIVQISHALRPPHVRKGPAHPQTALGNPWKKLDGAGPVGDCLEVFVAAKDDHRHARALLQDPPRLRFYRRGAVHAQEPLKPAADAGTCRRTPTHCPRNASQSDR